MAADGSVKIDIIASTAEFLRSLNGARAAASGAAKAISAGFKAGRTRRLSGSRARRDGGFGGIDRSRSCGGKNRFGL